MVKSFEHELRSFGGRQLRSGKVTGYNSSGRKGNASSAAHSRDKQSRSQTAKQAVGGVLASVACSPRYS